MKHLKATCVVGVVVVALLVPLGSASAGGAIYGGALDPTFGTGGLTSTPVSAMGAGTGDVSTAAVQPDGKVLVGGFLGNTDQSLVPNPDWVIARYNADGSPDTSFGTNGLVSTCIPGPYGYCPGQSGGVRSIVALPDGKILAIGTAAGAFLTFARYNPDGSLDSTFGTDGIVVEQGITGGSFSVVQPDGKIVVLVGLWGYNGIYDFEVDLARFNADGTLDSSFGTNGMTAVQPAPSLAPSCPAYSCSSGFEDLALGPNGTLVVGGWDAYAVGNPSVTANWVDYGVMERFSSNGTADSGFGTNGVAVVHDGGGRMTVQPDGKIVFANDDSSSGGDSLRLVRANADGSRDTTFGKDGEVISSLLHPQGLLVQPDGKIVVVADWNKDSLDDRGIGFGLERLMPDGSLDQSFGISGRALIDFGAGISASPRTSFLQPDGKIVAAGSSWGVTGSPAPISWVAMRYLPDGSTPLSVTETGTGTVDSTPLGISCGTEAICAAQFADQSTVTLTADPSQGLQVSWHGACTGHPVACQITAGARSTVHVTFAKAKFCLVPRVTGKLLADAETLIQQNACAVGKVKNAASKTIAAGNVVSQKPGKGVKKKVGAKVALVVSTGPPQK